MTRRLAATKAAELLKDSIHDVESPSRLDAGGMGDDDENDSDDEGDENDDEETVNRGAPLAGAAPGTALVAFVKKEKTKWTAEEVCFSLHCAFTYVDALISLFLTTPPSVRTHLTFRTMFCAWLFAHTKPKIGKRSHHTSLANHRFSACTDGTRYSILSSQRVPGVRRKTKRCWSWWTNWDPKNGL